MTTSLGPENRTRVREFVELSFAHAGLDWEKYVEIDPRYFRPAEVDALEADPSKARTVLGWQTEVSFHQLVRMMVDADLGDLRRRLEGGVGALQTASAQS